MSARLRLLLVLLVLGLCAACQVVDQTGQQERTADTSPAPAPALGSPDEEWPMTLAGMRAFAAPEALEWQDLAILADVTVWLTPEQRWDRVRLTYVAEDADRLFTYRSSPQDLRIERPLLQGLQLPSLPAPAISAIEPFPAETLEPVALAQAAAPALAECGGNGDDAGAVLYATGAPAAWDGAQWTRLPNWRATVVTPTVGVVVDPSTGQAFAPLTCVEPVLLQAG